MIHSNEARGLSAEQIVAAIAGAVNFTGSPSCADRQLAMAREGRTVFIDFTAEWCVTCKAYEKTVIDTEEIRAAFAKSCVETVKADYTNEDEEITRWLKKYNRPGVPMYLIIPAGKPDGVITLPDLLTKASIIDGLKASGPSNDCAG